MKAVAVPYLVAIIIAVIVLGVLGYWFLTTAGGGGAFVSEAFCRAKLLQYCSDLKTNKITPNTDDFYEEYAKGCSTYKGRPGWDQASPDLKKCDTLLGV